MFRGTNRRLNLLSIEEGNRSRLSCIHKKDGQTALMQAAEAGHLPLVRLLLARGDKANASDQFGVTPLMRACAHGHEAVARLLLARVQRRRPPPAALPHFSWRSIPWRCRARRRGDW